jgi:hypothetical protein
MILQYRLETVSSHNIFIIGTPSDIEDASYFNSDKRTPYGLLMNIYSLIVLKSTKYEKMKSIRSPFELLNYADLEAACAFVWDVMYPFVQHLPKMSIKLDYIQFYIATSYLNIHSITTQRSKYLDKYRFHWIMMVSEVTQVSIYTNNDDFERRFVNTLKNPELPYVTFEKAYQMYNQVHGKKVKNSATNFNKMLLLMMVAPIQHKFACEFIYTATAVTNCRSIGNMYFTGPTDDTELNKAQCYVSTYGAKKSSDHVHLRERALLDGMRQKYSGVFI